MKNNKGFTLVELLAVLMLLGLIVVISVPTINSSLKTAKERASKVQKEIILNAAKNYAADNPDEIKQGINMISVSDLANLSYIDASNSDIFDASKSDEKNYYGDKCVYINYNSAYNQYEYEIVNCNTVVDEDCFTYTTTEIVGKTYAVITGYHFDDEVNGKECSMDVVIPAKVHDLEVIKIAANAFDRTNKTKKLSSLIISQASSLQEIGSRAFASNNITSLTYIPSSLRIIGERAFENNAITELNLDIIDNKNVTNVDDFVEPQIEQIKSYAFSGNHIATLDTSKLTSLTEIADGVFDSNLLTSIDLSKLSNITRIGNSAFRNNLLSKVSIKNFESLTNIGEEAFAQNEIQTVSLVNLSKLVSIGVSAFKDNSITKLSLEALPLLETIGVSAFENNSRIETLSLVNLPALKNVEVAAFRNAGISTINISNCSNLKTFEEEAFASNNISSLDLRNSSLETIGVNCFRANNLKQVVLPSTITSLTSGTFYISDSSNKNLTSIYNPGSTSFNWHYVFGANSSKITDSNGVDGFFEQTCTSAGTTSGYECKSTADSAKFTVKIYNQLP